MNRRHFAKLLGLGVFSILPGAGRVWKATKPEFLSFEEIIRMRNDLVRLDGQYVPVYFAYDQWSKKTRLFLDVYNRAYQS